MERIKGNSKQVKRPEEIANILGVAMSHRWQFGYSVVSGERRISQNTEIVKVDTDRGALIVGSEVKYADIAPEETVTFRAQSGGITLRFDTRLMEVSGNALANKLFSECRVNFPEVLVYTQLRRAIRINCIDLDHIPVTFFGEDGKHLEGDVADISATGVKVKFKGNLSSYFEDSRSVSDCRMRLPDDSTLEGRVKVLGFLFDKEQDISYIRCYFLEMQEDHELKLEELITATLRKIDRTETACPPPPNYDAEHPLPGYLYR